MVGLLPPSIVAREKWHPRASLAADRPHIRAQGAEGARQRGATRRDEAATWRPGSEDPMTNPWPVC